MSFPSSSGTRANNDLAVAWGQSRAFAGEVKRRAQAVRTLSANGQLDASNVLDLSTFLADMRFEFQRIAAIDGIGAFAQSQVVGIDLAAEFTAMVNAIDATIAWIVANFPKDVGGFLLARTILANGRQVDRIFTAPATATLRTVLDALIATID